MTIQSKQLDQNTVVLSLSGKLDTNSAAQFELDLKPFVEATTDIIFDFKDLSYISSSGLHVVLQTLKTMKKDKRKLVIKNMCAQVKEVFEITGVIGLLTVE